MGQPTEPTPGAPAPAPTPPAPTPPAPAAPPAPAPVPAPMPFDPASLSPEAQAYLKSQIDAADLKARTGSKANAAAEARQEIAAAVAKALGLTEEVDPAALADQVQQARDAAWVTSVE